MADLEQVEQDRGEPERVVDKDQVQKETPHSQILEAKEDIYRVLQKALNKCHSITLQEKDVTD